MNLAPAGGGAGGTAEILMYGDIGFDFTAKDFINRLAELGEVDRIDLRINSPGGLAADGVAIYQALARHPSQRNVWIDSQCYSAATIVAMAASPGCLRMAFNARMMIHNGWAFMMGDKFDLRKEANSLEILDGTIAATYAKRTGQTKQAMQALMDEETWFDAEGAKAAGLIDDIFEPAEDPATIEGGEELNLVRRFKKLPSALNRHSRAGGNPAADADEAARIDVMHRWAQLNERAA
jgi:ATP-dependent protease ClpP protease subunit